MDFLNLQWRKWSKHTSGQDCGVEKNIRLGNFGTFIRTEMDQLFLMARVDRGAH
jgi:hypothetical protein